MRRLIDLIFLIVVIFVGYHYRYEIERGILIAGKEFGIIAPCSRPISYSIGTFDTRFGISKETFIKELHDASQLWENASDRDLFVYKEDRGDVTVNLVYDYRQESTQQLNNLGETIDSSRVGYNTLKAQHSSLNSKINSNKAEYERLLVAFEAAKKEYATRVSEWNRGTKNSKSQYDSLQAEQEQLNAQVALIKQKQTQINNDVDSLNILAGKLNTLAKELNIKVEEYNTIGQSTGEAFDEGEFVSDINGDRINIYQYSNPTKLDRVLAHEFGHALGLEHVENAQSIMYYLNGDSSRELSTEDISELTTICKL